MPAKPLTLIAACALLSACGGATIHLGQDAGGFAGPDATAWPDAAAPGPDAATAAGPDATVDPRQPLRDHSLFANGSFEDVTADQPVGWKCAYFGTGTAPAPLCTVHEGDAVDGKRYLEIAPGVAAYARATTPTPPQQVRFDLFARAPQGISPSSFYLLEMSGKNMVRSLSAMTATPAQGGWSFVESYSAPLDSSDQLTLVLDNEGAEPIQVDDVVAVEIVDPIVVPGHLLAAEGYDAITCSSGTEEAVLWLPLPLMHGVQVPLDVEFVVDPPGAFSKVEYSLDPEGNLGVLVHVDPATEFDEASLSMKSVVLTREATADEMTALYPAAGDPSSWLAATEVVQWQDPDLDAAALKVVAGLTDPLSKLSAILGWTSTYVTNPSQLTSLDALSVFKTKNGSCTGFANLGAAAGRAAGVPARSVANYLVGMAQQTHYIDELWLGPEAGWRLVEPQGTLTLLPPEYAVVVRLDLVDDESAAAMDPSSGWAIPGVPFKSLLRAVAGADRCQATYPSQVAFPECPECDHKATYQAGLKGDKARVVSVFERARALWGTTLATLQVKGPDAAEQQLRAQALSARDLDAVEALLAELEAGR